MSFELQKKLKKTFNKINFIDNDISLQNKNRSVIWDKTCPICKNPVIDNNSLCLCGYSLSGEKTVKLWGIVVFTWLFIIAFVFLIFNSFSQLNSIIYEKIESSDSNFYSLSPVNIQIISSLKNSRHRDYIQSIYVNSRAKNKLMVLIKPVYWDMLSLKEKTELKQVIIEKWKKIYKNMDFDSKLKPEVHFANFE